MQLAPGPVNSAYPRRPGRLLAFEGLDGAGKTTLSQLVAARLGAAWFTTPSAAFRPLRDAAEAALGHDPLALQALYAATVLATCAEIRPVLASGRDVVVDRWWASTLVYAGQRGRSFPAESMEDFVVPAQFTVFVDAADEVRAARLAARGLSAHDRDTLPALAAADLRARYATVLRRPVMGRTLAVDATDRAPGALVEAVLRGMAGSERQGVLWSST